MSSSSKNILKAIRNPLTNNTPENARVLAEAAGLRIKKPSSSDDLIPNFLKPYTPPTKNKRAINNEPNKKIKTYGWDRYLMSQNLTNEELEMLRELTRLKHKTNKNGIYLYDKQGLKKLDTLSWITTWRLNNNDEAKFGKMLDTDDIKRIREEVQRDYENNHFDDIGGFNFEPVIDLDQTLKAIKENRYDSVTNNDPKEIISAIRQALDTPSDENIQALAEVAGLRIQPVMTDGFVKKGASRYKYVIWGVPKDGSLEELLFTQNQQGEVIATIEKAKDIKAVLEDKYGVTKARIQEVDLGGGFDFSKEIAQPQADEKAAKDKAIADKQDSNKLNAQEQAVMDVMLKSGTYNFATIRDNNDFSKLADFSNEEFDIVGLILEDTENELTKKVIKHILENSTDYPNAIGKNMVAVSDLDDMNIAPLAKLAKIKKTAKTPDDLFKLMASSAANQDVRYYLTGVKVEDNGDLISTDGHSMTIIRDSGINREAGIYPTAQRLEGLKRALLKQGKSQEEINKDIKAQEDSFKGHKFPEYKRVYPNKRRFVEKNILKIDVAKLKGIVDSIVKAFRRVISNKFLGISLEFNQNEIVFNVQYLQNGLDLMASMGYKQVNLYLQEDARSPILIEPEDEKVSFIVMPMVGNRNYKAIKTINLNNLDDWNWSKSNFDGIDTEDDEDDYYWLCQEELAL